MAGLFDPAVFQPNTFQNDTVVVLNVFQKCLFQANVFQTDACGTSQDEIINFIIIIARRFARR